MTGNVSWNVTDDQSWLSASPASGSGNGNFTISATANTGTTARTGTVTATGGGITRTVAVTQAGVSTGGSVTATGLVTSSSGWFSEEQVRVNNTANITALTVTISVQRTAGLNAAGQYNTVGGQITQSSSCTTTVCTYVFTLGSGQTLTPGTGRSFAAQMSGNGTVHPTAGDTFTGVRRGRWIGLQRAGLRSNYAAAARWLRARSAHPAPLAGDAPVSRRAGAAGEPGRIGARGP